MMRHLVGLGLATALAACGGGGGGGGGTGSPPPTPTLAVTLSAASANVTVEEGQSQAFGFTANYSGTSSSPIVPDVQVAGSRVELNGTPTASGTSFNVPLRTVALAPGGAAPSTVTFRLCTSSICSEVYPGSTQTFTVNLDVRLKDWGTFQRDAAHTGYVAVNYNTADFAVGWSIPMAPFAPTEIAARRGSIFVNLPQANGNLVTRALNSANGNALWTYDLGLARYFSGPSYTNGRVASMAMDHSSFNLPLQIISAESGSALGALSYASQFSNGGVPTPVGDNLYFQAGYFGNVVYAANIANVSLLWSKNSDDLGGGQAQAGAGVVQEGESVAADENHVYFFSGGNLTVFSRPTGVITHRIRNPYFTRFGLSYYGRYRGAPILGRNGGIFTFSDNRDVVTPLPLVGFSLANTEALWRTAATYVGHPALRDDTLFAIRSSGTAIDLINTVDGTVSGSIDFGSGRGSLISNVIVTGSHLFVASDTATYAVDLRQASNPVVWSAPQGGALAITPDNILVVSAKDGIYAYRLAA